VASQGAAAVALAFFAWGLFPIYWRLLEAVSTSELVAQRIIWSTVFLVVIVLFRGRLKALAQVFTQWRACGQVLLASMLLALNWTLFVWAVNSGFIIETSLGYFLTPLFNVSLGFVFLKERLYPVQWLAVGCAVAGVLVLLLHAGHVPWVALGIASSWSLYGILKKQSSLGPITGLTAETLLLLPLAAAYLYWVMQHGEAAWSHAEFSIHLLLVGLGIVTTVPLLLFAYGVKRIPLTTVGLLQYISPTLQFLIGIYLYNEPFDAARLQAFILIWVGLAIYTWDSFTTVRPSAAPLK
jgi:chloramphenicol-sensitive protein RarD